MFIHIIFSVMNILQHMFFFTINFMSGFPPWSLVDDRSGRSWSKERKWAWPSPEVVGVDVASCSIHEVTRVTLLPNCQPCGREWLEIETECGVNCHQQGPLCQKRWPWYRYLFWYTKIITLVTPSCERPSYGSLGCFAGYTWDHFWEVSWKCQLLSIYLWSLSIYL